ncbi:MAG TPA: hypothetical protein VHH36_03735 [Candidatus Thermoplasmatota archaeon]|nr:hypothetical protein [Candidatus Thermoplasmatota archaeon]
MADRQPSPIPRLLAALLVASLAATAFPVAAGGADGTPDCPADDPLCDVEVPEACKRAGSASAAIANVKADGVTLQTQAGSQTLLLPRQLVALAVSTTGVLDVEVEHRCVLWYTFSWTVNGQLGTSAGSSTAYPRCAGDTDVHQIPIGNDVADVHMELHWVGCDGAKGSDVRDAKVVDPDLKL